MELFEEVGQTLSRTGQSLAQKARDTAQVTKLKLAVSEDERAIEGFVQRGRQLLHQLRRKSAGGKGRCVHLPGLRQQAQARRGLLYAVRQARPVISEKEKDKGY